MYTTQDTTALVRVFLQVRGVFRHTARLINVVWQVNCSFQVYYPGYYRLILCNPENKSAVNEGTQHDLASHAGVYRGARFSSLPTITRRGTLSRLLVYIQRLLKRKKMLQHCLYNDVS